jgi:ABC-type transporter Mla MlaB component
MTAVSHTTSSRPVCGQRAIRPELLPGDDADAGQEMSPLSVSRSHLGLAVIGEIDESSFCFFAEALVALASGLSLVQIDLAGVEYCDVAGLHLMVRLTRADDLDGDNEGVRRVVLHGAAPHLRAVLGVLGWDCTPGLVLG